MTDRAAGPHPLAALTLARFKLTIREPEMVFWVFVFPIVLALALGLAFQTRGEEPVPVAVRDMPGAAPVLAALEQAGGLEAFVTPGEDEAVLLRDGGAHLVVVPGSPPTYRYDAARPESRLARVLVDGALAGAAGHRPPWTARTEEVATPGSRYIDWLIPGLLGMNVMGSSMWGIGFGIVVARSRKLLKRMIATPMRRSHFLASLVLSRLAFLAVEMLALLAFAAWVFGVGNQGGLAALAAVALTGALAFGGIGLLTGSRARTIEGVSGIMNFMMLPMWICSGVFFAVTNFPEAVQPFIRLLPLTALIDALRGVMLNGEALAGVGAELGVLTAWGAVSFALALRVFRWQ